MARYQGHGDFPKPPVEPDGMFQLPEGNSTHQHEITMKSTIYKQFQWIGLREYLQENPIFNGKIYGFL